MLAHTRNGLGYVGSVLPLATDRLHIRLMTVDDAPRVAAYRNDPDVAHYQDWPLPYTVEMFLERFAARGEVSIAQHLTLGTNLVIEVGGRPVGDVYIRVDDGLAEVGWTLVPDARGQGYATEAAAAMMQLLFSELGAHRVEASLHPDNVASARVCEAIGMTFELNTRLNFRGRNGWEDDAHYAALRPDWEDWINRPLSRPSEVCLVELGPQNADVYGGLATHRSQERLVAPMLASFQDALFPELHDGFPVVPWMRGIEADGQPAGFIMLAAVNEHHPQPYLWRLLIDRRYQRRGIGGVALGIVGDLLRAQGSSTLSTSWVEGPGSPRGFYEQLGFVPTGDVDDGETVAQLTL